MRQPLRFLSAEQVMAIHGTMLDRWGGRTGGGPRGAAYEGVDAAVQAVKNSYYQSREELAAAYAVYIIQGHVFWDGNKRTGAAAMLTFLAANGADTRIPPSRLVAMMINLQRRAETGEDTARLIAWIAGELTRGTRSGGRSRGRQGS